MLLIKSKFYGFSIFQRSLTWQEEEKSLSEFLSPHKVRSSWQQPRICWRSLLNYFSNLAENSQKLFKNRSKILRFVLSASSFLAIKCCVVFVQTQQQEERSTWTALCIHLHRLLTLPNHSCLAQQWINWYEQTMSEENTRSLLSLQHEHDELG